MVFLWFSAWESTLHCTGHWFDTWYWKIPRASGKLTPGTTTEPVLWSSRVATTEPKCSSYWSLRSWSPCSTTREALALQLETRSPLTATRESPQAATPKRKKFKKEKRVYRDLISCSCTSLRTSLYWSTILITSCKLDWLTESGKYVRCLLVRHLFSRG